MKKTRQSYQFTLILKDVSENTPNIETVSMKQVVMMR